MNSKNNVKQFLEQLLNEAQPINRPESMADFAPTEQKPVSLDQAVDKYLIQYERESIPTSEVYESNNLNSLMGFLLEQEEEPVEDEAEEEDEGGLELPGGDEDLGLDLGGDEEEPSPAGDDDTPAQEPVVATPKINLQDFTRNLARLVNNSQALIDFQTLILNRAESYIKNNYDERTAKEMMGILENQWDLKPVEDEVVSNDTPKYPQPTTAVTGPVGG